MFRDKTLHTRISLIVPTESPQLMRNYILEMVLYN